MKKIKVTYFQRKTASGHFSLESIYEDLRKRLKIQIDANIHIAKYYSSGFFKRIYNLLEAPFHQGEINHITGDIHYVSFLLQKKKTLLTIADCVFMNTDSKIKRSILWFFWLYIPSKRVNRIISISNFTKNSILKYLPSFPENKISVIHVAVSDIFQYTPKEFNKDKPRILHIGSAPNKNLIRLLEAIKDIPCKVVIIGKLTKEYLSKLLEYGIEYENYFNLSEKELFDIYITSDLLAFVSTYEGFGMPIVEANKVGRSVITSNIASMSEVANDAALLIDPFDISSIREGVLKIIKNDEYRETLIKKGLANAERFNATILAQNYFSLYEQILLDEN